MPSPFWGLFVRSEYRRNELNQDVVDGYSIPVDPMDLLQCDSCQ